ncbi:MAG: T9SS type A sorting domain-containing protein [Brumimicrobium sp.]
MKIVFITVITFLALHTHAQKATVSSGGDISGTDGSVSYTVGQIDYQYASGSNGDVTEGVQQIEIDSITGLNENQTNIELNAFPNPAYDHIVIETNAPSGFENVSYNMYDNQGRLVKEGKISSFETSVDVSDLIKANYFLKVTKENQLIKTFKIVKN